MEEQTRQLLVLLANADIESVLGALGSGPATIKDIEAVTDLPDTSIDRHLRALEQYGLARRAGKEREPGRRGRPKTRWELVAADQAQRFSNIADAFALELLESKTERLRQAINARRRSDLSGDDTQAA